MAFKPDEVDKKLDKIVLMDQDGVALELFRSQLKCEVDTLDSYEMERQIQNGGFATIYLGKKKSKGTVVAIKKPQWRRNATMHSSTRTEIQVLTMIDHPNIARLHALLLPEKDHPPCLALDFYKYDLNHLLYACKYVPQSNEIKCIVKQLLDGILYLHSLEIIHGDMKPDNVMFDERGRAKIIDFGLSKVRVQTATPDAHCSRWHCAPEVLLEMPTYTSAVDLWALGCIMAELYQQKPLAKGRSQLDQMNLIIGILGTPTKITLPEIEKSKFLQFLTLRDQPSNFLRSKFSTLEDEEFKVLTTLLLYNPKEREDVIKLMPNYLKECPQVCDPQDLSFIQQKLEPNQYDYSSSDDE